MNHSACLDFIAFLHISCHACRRQQMWTHALLECDMSAHQHCGVWEHRCEPFTHIDVASDACWLSLHIHGDSEYQHYCNCSCSDHEDDYCAMVSLVTPHLDVSTAAALLCRQGLKGSTGEALMPGQLAAHAELVAAAVAGSADILTPGRYPTVERCQDLKQCNMFSCTVGWYD